MEAELDTIKKVAEIDAEKERRQLELENKQLELENKQLERENKQAERQKRLILKELEIQKLAINEEYEIDDKNSIMTVDTEQWSKKNVQEWVNSIAQESETTERRHTPLCSVKDVRNDRLGNNTKSINEHLEEVQLKNKGLSNDNLNICLRRQIIDKKLPYFNGDPTEWLIFITEYKETTEACNFSDIENLARLRKSLKGDARETVKMLLLSHKNVPEIIQTLESRYGKPDYVIKSLICQAKATPPPKESKPESLVKFATVVNNLVTAVRHLDNEYYMKSINLLEELVNYLPPNLKQRWAEHAVDLDRDITLLEFDEWIKKVGRAASLFLPQLFAEVNNKDVKNCKQKLEAVFTTSEGKDVCLLCNKGKHGLQNCFKIGKIDVNERCKIVKDNKLCISCLKRGHHLTQCSNRRCCGINNCQRYHNRLLHKDNEESKLGVEDDNSQQVLATCNIFAKANVALRILPVILKGPNGCYPVYALLDEGSTITLLEATVAHKIGLQGAKEPLCIQWTNETTHTDDDSERVNVLIRGDFEGAKEYNMTNVRTVRKLGLPSQSFDIMSLKKQWPHLNSVPAKSLKNIRPTVLIGTDNYDLTMPRKSVEGMRYDPRATLTKLGWVISGHISAPKGRVDKNLIFHTCEFSGINDNDNELHKIVKDFIAIENLGVKHFNENIRSQEDAKAMKILENTTKRIGYRLETGLLWKHVNFSLPESRANAFFRLKCQERKMDRDREFGELYCEKIRDYVSKGYLRKLEAEEVKREEDNVWYLPHFAVKNPNKPGKIRLVFDAESKCQGISINDMLLTGPDLMCTLLHVLWKFRQWKIGFCGDIREMFHQVKIRKEDQKFQRILWRGFDRTQEPDVFEMQVMTFGAVCSPSAAQYVKNRNADEHQHKFPRARIAIVEKHYVDDYLDSCDTEEEAINLIKEVTEVHKNGGFEICGWLSNSKAVMLTIPEGLRVKELKDMHIDTQLPAGRVLGIWWNPETDCFNFTLNFHKLSNDILDGRRRPTKRDILKLTMSIFDPLGFLGTVTVRAKILLQEIWRVGFGWDDEVSETIYVKWKMWLNDLKDVINIQIPRCYSPNILSSKSIQLHTFCDASEKAFSAVMYLRIETEGAADVTFISGKTRVAPVKPMSIPRLELQAALMGSRLANELEKVLEFEISRRYFWTDSQTVLSWLRCETKRYKQFVAHRVGEIHELNDTNEWRWVPTNLNVADEATRDTKTNTASNKWLYGPDFLRQTEDKWPIKNIKSLQTDEEEQVDKIEKEFVGITRNLEELQLPDIQRFSSWMRLIRATGWMLRFVARCKRLNCKGELTVQELEDAELLWWKKSQSNSFAEDIKNVLNREPLNNSSRLKELTPFLDRHGVLRVKGRIERAHIDYDEKHQIILDGKHAFTELLVRYYHVLAGHQGRLTVINNLRQKYWILNVTSTVKKIWYNCQFCKIRKAKVVAPLMGDLPMARVGGAVRPFTYTGMDYFGPLYVTVGRRREKRYGVLFTCMTMRAVHLEVASTLTTDSAIMSIQRMSARRGNPLEIFSDNGTNLKGAEKEIRVALGQLQQNVIISKLAVRSIKWHFNPPTAAHMGGSWERLIGSVKRVLNVVLKERFPKEEVLLTLFAEVEFTVNSRPLTPVSLDPNDEEALTPNHFLLGSSGRNRVYGITENNFHPRRQWMLGQMLSDHFWKRWVKEYLPILIPRRKWYKTNTAIVKGDVVIIVDDQTPRNTWMKGIVTALYPGHDGHVRVVDVKTAFGTYRRPVTKLCILDVQRSVPKPNTENN